MIGLAATPWAAARAATPSPEQPSTTSAQAGKSDPAMGRIGSVVPLGSGDKRQLKVDFSASKVIDGRTTAQNVAERGATISVKPVGGQSIVAPADVGLASKQQQTRTVMLALDISGSMQENDSTGQDKLKAEQAAALNFVDNQPPGTRVGIVAFRSPADLLLAPTVELPLVKQTISGLPRSKEARTGLYQAINLAAKQLNTRQARTGQRLLVMVTDGNNATAHEDSNSSSDSDLTTARAAISANTFFFRGVIIGGPDKNDLQKVAPGGDVLSNTTGSGITEKLNEVFESSNDALNKEAALTIPLDPRISGSVRVFVQARTTSGEIVTDTYSTVLVPTATSSATSTAQAAPVGSSGRPMISTPVMLAALLAVFLAVTLLVSSATGAFGGAARDAETPVSKALSFYSVRAGRPEQVTTPQKERSGSRLTRSAINAINRVARQRKLDRALDARLEAAGLPIRTAEWSLLHIGAGIGGGLLLLVASRGMVLGAILGLAIGLAGPWMFLALRKSRRESKFLAQLPDTLQLLAGSLASGYSLPQAMDAVLRESQPPIRDEFNRALVETRLGMPPEEALDGIADRTGSRDFSWIVMAIRIQRNVGGNLAELLSTVAETLRERERLRRQVKALSAEGRLSGIILGSLPLVFALFLIFTKPDYIAPLFQTPIGWLMLGVGTVLLVVGSIWMAKTVTVEV